ncbi:MAG: rhodanese-like domain-containing protein [Thermodesulfobacteriota bacterium]|nr:rhodanese-like domain-containing protein [Thermodesulfobacteriota bacterium]
MDKKRKGFLLFILIFFMIIFFAACGDSTHNKATPESEAGSYPNAGLLVSGDSLEASLGDSGSVIIDARSSGYTDSHIPGAISLIWSDYTDENVNLKPVVDLESQLSAAGLSRNMKFIIYDDTTASWGAAGRIFWMLEYLGCTDVHILNGGWDKWVEDGRSAEATINTLPEDTFVADVQEDRLADKDHILNRLGEDDFVIIDPREDEEYNGWTLYGETRGGHIRSAVSVNYKWFFNSDKTVLSYENLKDLLESSEITTDKEVISYCTAGIRSGFIYFALRLMGYEQCSNYDGSMYEWSADAACPMDMIKNYHKLVYPAWVEELIAGGNPGIADSPATYPGNGYIIIEASSLYWKGAANPDGYNPHEDYESGHIPGAISIPLNTLDTTVEGGIYPWTCPEDGNLLPPSELQSVIEGYGITYDITAIVYCGKNSYLGGCYRVAWALMCAGVEDVRYLNGDLPAWLSNGGTLENTPNVLPNPVDFGIPIPAQHPIYRTTTEEVEEMLLDPSAVVVDIRSWEEHIGDVNPYDFFDTKGHIPGDVYGENMGCYLDGDGTLRSYTEVKKMWCDRGITPNKKVTFY